MFRCCWERKESSPTAVPKEEEEPGEVGWLVGGGVIRHVSRDGWMNRWMDGMDAWMDGWTDAWMDGFVHGLGSGTSTRSS